ncbi:MAG: DEAD/DEAH box helicase [Actinomycetota bacterium]
MTTDDPTRPIHLDTPAADETADDLGDDVDGDVADDVADGLDDELTGFEALGLSSALCDRLAALGFDEPTPIQAESIPPLLDGLDVLGNAATGTGKTAAFALPMLDRILDGGRRSGPRAPFSLILVPTRELANQVSDAIEEFAAGSKISVVAVFGGAHIGPQLDGLRRGADIVVGTPGRVLDHLKRGSLDLSQVAIVALDEADEMLDMGFAEDLEAILEAAPPERQTVLFSATMPARISSIANRQLDDPVRIEIERPQLVEGEAPAIRQLAYLAPRSHRAAALARVLDLEQPAAAIVFCRTRHDVDELSDELNRRGERAEALHGGMGQEQRDKAMGRLKSGVATLLIATDVAARGIDVEHLSHVVNYDVPQTGEAYVHRIGRVGRAGRTGVAITLGGPKDHRRLHRLAQHSGHEIEIRPIPGPAQVIERRFEITRDEVAALLADPAADLSDGAATPERAIVERLLATHDPVEVATAAIRLAHRTAGRDRIEEEIPDVTVRSQRDRGDRFDRGDRRDRGRHDGRRDRGDHRDRSDRGDRSDRRPRRDQDGRHQVEAGFVSLQFSLGRHAGMRPGDLVGAIANEAGLRGGDIGAIKINDKSSFVEVPQKHAGKVMTSLDGAKIRNKQVRVRRSK